jgi:heterodisulfide reductase subunit A2
MQEKRDKPANGVEHKVGVYVCQCGGNISDHLDVDQVCERARAIPGVVLVRDNMFMCSDPGQELIMDDLRTGRVDRVVVASCAPSLHEMTFRNALARAGTNPYVYEHANIREQVSWVHHGDAATDKAARLVAAAVAKAGTLEPLEPIRMEAKRHATVIGGGIAGLTAARDLALRGIDVTLLERTPFLGGWAAQLDRLAPTGEPVAPLLKGLATAVLNHPAITVCTFAEVVTFRGYIGNFRLEVRKRPPVDAEELERLVNAKEQGKSSGEFMPFVGILAGETPDQTHEFTIDTGVVVFATGFKPYVPEFGDYGFGHFEEVVTLPQLIRCIAANQDGNDRLEVHGRKISNIALIHCVGSREIPGIHEEGQRGYLNEYCSRTCCSATLHAANLIRERYSATHVFEFYRDIRTYARGQEELYQQAARNGVLFFRFGPEAPPVVSRAPQRWAHPLRIVVADTLTFGEEIEIPADLVVLAVGMEPADVSDLVTLMKLPVGADRFLQEVHPKLRPVELSVSGVLLAGTCQAPMDIGEACAAAAAAAVKASSLLARGFVELDPFVAEVDLDKCRGTGACVEACLRDGALAMVELVVAGEVLLRAQANPALCLGCGACVAVCPENAINVKGWALKQYEAMVDMIVADDLAA